MKSFYEQTGYSFGAFAEYKTNLGIIKNITDEAKNLPEDEKSIIDNEFTMAEAIKIIADAFGYAYQNPLIECDYTTVNIETIFGNAAKIIPQYSDDLMVAASLRTFFDLPNAQTDYVTDDLIRNAANKRVKVKYPEFENLLNNMKSLI